MLMPKRPDDLPSSSHASDTTKRVSPELRVIHFDMSYVCKAFPYFPGNFFSAEYDKRGSSPAPSTLTTIPQMRTCITSGCPWCTILLAHADTSWFSEECMQRRPVVLARARIDPEQSFRLLIGGDDFSRTYFFRVPIEWSLSPAARLDKPWDDVTLMRTWLSNCVSKHSECGHNANRGLPKRLLDVSAFSDSDDIRLVDGRRLPFTAKYVTLSHCWGPPNKHPQRTERKTLSDRMQRIEFQDLSLTFQDAVSICRDLDQRYLWIDSLCIIQDDGDDWAEQAAAMASIYGGSYVTLSALSSVDSSQGCRIQSQASKESELSRYHDFEFGSQRVRLFEDRPNEWHTDYGDDPYKHEGYGLNPLRTRAWTLQERELSPRCIHFGQDQLLWECRTMKGSSQLPWHEMIRKYDDGAPLPLKLHEAESYRPNSTAFQRDSWYSLVEDYSSRYMTKEIDKLPALAGLAAEFSKEETIGDYLAGIWSRHLPSALLWNIAPIRGAFGDRPTQPLAAFQPRRPQKYRAPSWSWASIDGEVSYESQRRRLLCEISEIIDPGCRGCDIITSSDQAAMTLNHFHATSVTMLRIRGYITEVGVNMHLVEGDYSKSLRRLVDKNGTTVGGIYPDIATELQFVKTVCVLSVRSEPHDSAKEIPFDLYEGEENSRDQMEWNDLDLRMGLALLRVGFNGNYRRVGLVRWLKKQIFDDLEPMEVTVI